MKIFKPKRLITYSLFQSKHTRNYRVWDDHVHELNRYWYNIPAIIVYNSVLYPDAQTKFFVDTHTINHELFSILDSDFVTIEHIEDDFYNTEPSIWRMKPLWDDEVDCFFPRDVDSVPTKMEYAYTRYFIESTNYGFMTLRSHENHHHEEGCDILAGLCGFRKSNLDQYPETYTEYFSKRNNGSWSMDQGLLLDTFLKHNSEKLKTIFLDAPIEKQSRKSFYPCAVAKQDSIQMIIDDLTEEQKYLLDLNYHICSWSGEPVDYRKKYLLEMFKLENDVSMRVKEKIEQNDNLKRFYL